MLPSVHCSLCVCAVNTPEELGLSVRCKRNTWACDDRIRTHMPLQKAVWMIGDVIVPPSFPVCSPSPTLACRYSPHSIPSCPRVIARCLHTSSSRVARVSRDSLERKAENSACQNRVSAAGAASFPDGLPRSSSRLMSAASTDRACHREAVFALALGSSSCCACGHTCSWRVGLDGRLSLLLKA